MNLSGDELGKGNDVNGEGNMLTRKVGPFPAWVWLAGAAVLAYFIMSRQSSSQAGSPKTTGGGGSITTGPTRIAKDAVKITVNTGHDADDQDQPGPKPPHRHRHHSHSGNPAGDQPLTTVTIHRAGTLNEIAAARGWGEDFLKDVENLNSLKPGSKLRRGQKLRIPKGNVQSNA